MARQPNSRCLMALTISTLVLSGTLFPSIESSGRIPLRTSDPGGAQMWAMLQQTDATTTATLARGQAGVGAKLKRTSEPPSILRSAFHHRPGHHDSLAFVTTSLRLDTTCLKVLYGRSPPTNLNTQF